jgi:CheY-like chemotaxis protein
MINILLVEDNIGFRHLLKEMFNESSLMINLVEANNPLEGLDQMTKYKYNFDFVICDFFLPIQNGNDFLELIKTHNKSIVCILISADESLMSKNFPHFDHFFAKTDAWALVKYLKTHSFIGL